jgi:hypothetical protein
MRIYERKVIHTTAEGDQDGLVERQNAPTAALVKPLASNDPTAYGVTIWLENFVLSLSGEEALLLQANLNAALTPPKRQATGGQ